MKTVFTNKVCVEIWAQTRQPQGRANNLHFDDGTLYSYGNHFAVGHITDDNIVLLNSDRYSSTTSRHQSLARRATRQYTCHEVPDLTELLLLFRTNDKKRIRVYLAKHMPELKPKSVAHIMLIAGLRSFASSEASK